MLKQKIHLILPNSKDTSNDRFDLLIQHIIDAWHTLIDNQYADKTIATLYNDCKQGHLMQPFRAIHQWLVPVHNSASGVASHECITTIAWTVQLLDAIQIDLIRQHTETIQHCDARVGSALTFSSPVQNIIHYLLIDCSDSLNTHIQQYQTKLARIHSARQPIQPSANQSSIQTSNTIQKSLDNFTQITAQLLRQHTPEHYAQQLIQAIDAFIERLSMYRDSPHLLQLYRTQTLELAPPPFPLDNLVTWLNTYQLEPVADEVHKIVNGFVRALHDYLKQHQLQGVSPSPLFKITELRTAIDDYIHYIKTTADIQLMDDDSSLAININNLHRIIQKHTAQYKIAMTEYAALQVYGQNLKGRLNTMAAQIITLLQNPSSIIDNPNIKNIIQTTLMQRLQNPQYDSQQTPYKQTTHSSASSHSTFYQAVVKRSASTESLNWSGLFRSPHSVRSIHQTDSPLCQYHSHGKTI